MMLGLLSDVAPGYRGLAAAWFGTGMDTLSRTTTAYRS